MCMLEYITMVIYLEKQTERSNLACRVLFLPIVDALRGYFGMKTITTTTVT